MTHASLTNIGNLGSVECVVLANIGRFGIEEGWFGTRLAPMNQPHPMLEIPTNVGKSPMLTIQWFVIQWLHGYR